MIGQVIALIDNALITLQSGGNPADVIGMLTEARGLAEQVEKQGAQAAPAAPQRALPRQVGMTPAQQAQAAFGGRVAPSPHEIAREIFVSLQALPQGGTAATAYELTTKFLEEQARQTSMAHAQAQGFVQAPQGPQQRR